MRHKKAGVKLNRTTSHRQAMFRNMVTSLFKHERIRTTDVKAKELRRWADQIITLAKRGDLHARRQVLAIVREKEVAHKLFAEAEQRFGHLSGGYTRIVKIGARAGDAAPISLIELVSQAEKSKKGKKKAKAPAKKKETAAKAAAPTKKAKEKAAKPAESPPAEEAAAPPRETAPEADAPEAQAQTGEAAAPEPVSARQEEAGPPPSAEEPPAADEEAEPRKK